MSHVRLLRWAATAPRRRLRRAWSSRAMLRACHLHPQAELSGGGVLDFGPRVTLGRHAHLVVDQGHRLDLAEDVWIGDGCELNPVPRIRIGAGTSLQNRSQILGEVKLGAGCVCAANLYISSAWHHFADVPHLPIRVQDQRAQATPLALRSRAVEVGDDCWLGINVVVLPGVTIGRGCVVAANSVVRSDLPPYAVAAGAPARVVKQRLDFEPPPSIDATRDEHLPYFYAGLRQLATQGEAAVRRDRLGYAAQAEFALALAAAPSIELLVDAACAGSLTHGETTRPVATGRQRLRFAARPERWGVHRFGWQQADHATPDSLVVLEALALGTAEERS